MAVKIRLKRMGSKKKPFYRIIATDSRNPRDGRFIETLGYYNPLADPPEIKVDEEGLFKWLEKGATPSDNTESILRRTGSMQRWQLLKQGLRGAELDAKMEELGIKAKPVLDTSKKPSEAEEQRPKADGPDKDEASGQAEASNADSEESGS